MQQWPRERIVGQSLLSQGLMLGFLGASTVVMTGKSDPEVLEALACRGTIALPSDINTRQARVATDCLSVIKNLEAGTQWVYALVVKEILESKKEFEHLSSGHEGRISNK